ncbi:MAG: DUF4340 domain-containing protein [Bacteroidales bacterium]|nr:DUF4340 domain-containing protein [Bacteroidales bacterium]
MLSKFLNTKTLIILLVILLGIYLISKYTERGDRTFKSELVAVDTSKVTKIVISPKLSGEGNEVVFTKTGIDWKLESAGKFYKPDKEAVKNIFTELTKMKSKQVAATDESKWAEFEVTDSTGTRIRLYDGKKVLADLYVGKFNYVQSQEQNPYQQNRGSMSTYVRPAEDQEVYVVEGFLKMSIQANIDTYRDKNLFKANKDDITKISFNYPENKNFALTKMDNKWFLNGMPTDSMKTVGYLNKISRVTSSNFIDDVEPETKVPEYMVTIEGNNFPPTEIKAFPADSLNKYVITSSVLPDSKFSGEKAGLFKRVFANVSDFFAAEKK